MICGAVSRLELEPQHVVRWREEPRASLARPGRGLTAATRAGIGRPAGARAASRLFARSRAVRPVGPRQHHLFGRQKKRRAL